MNAGHSGAASGGGVSCGARGRRCGCAVKRLAGPGREEVDGALVVEGCVVCEVCFDCCVVIADAGERIA